MGLYVLTNTTIDVFGGMLSFRTKNYFMNIKAHVDKSNAKSNYQVKVKKYGSWVPNFVGNMVTIRLPLMKEHL